MKKKRGQNKSFSLNDSFKKNHRGLKINIKLSNRWLYFFITLSMIAIVGVGVYAWDASGAGHNADEIDFSGIGSGVIPSSAIIFSSPIVTPSMNHPYLVLDSASSGSNTNEQSAQISIGESGRGSAALHLAYTGDGYSYIGMGDLGSDNIPDYYAIRMYYGNNDIYFPGMITSGSTSIKLAPSGFFSPDVGDNCAEDAWGTIRTCRTEGTSTFTYDRTVCACIRNKYNSNWYWASLTYGYS